MITQNTRRILGSLLILVPIIVVVLSIIVLTIVSFIWSFPHVTILMGISIVTGCILIYMSED